MKKLLAVLCMLTCIFGLTACGNETVLTETDQNYIDGAIVKAQQVVSIYESLVENPESDIDFFLSQYSAKEAEYIMSNSAKMSMDGLGVKSSLTSFTSSHEAIGSILEYGEPAGEIKGKEIIVNIPVVCERGNANIEVIVTNDIFQKINACSINAELTTGQIMKKSGLNTILGMGTVFVVLILIMIIIKAFELIPKIQNKLKSKKNESVAIKQDAVTDADDLKGGCTDDSELIAVIAAAIAASEGSANTDDFVVRSIRRIKRR